MFGEWGLRGKEPVCSAGDTGLFPALGRSPGEGNGNPLQYSCLENSMDRGAWWVAVHGVAKGWTRHQKKKKKENLIGLTVVCL